MFRNSNFGGDGTKSTLLFRLECVFDEVMLRNWKIMPYWDLIKLVCPHSDNVAFEKVKETVCLESRK